MNDDTISRQAAIDALERIFDRCEEIEAHFLDGDPDKTGYKMFPDYITVWKYLHQLSSVERFSQKEKLKRCVESEDLFPDLPQIIKDKNTEIAKAYQEGYEQGKKDAERRGRWDNGFCSVCGEEALTEWNDTGGEYAFTTFCPNCGARMEEEA